jgi:hypothetical protein
MREFFLSFVRRFSLPGRRAETGRADRGRESALPPSAERASPVVKEARPVPPMVAKPDPPPAPPPPLPVATPKRRRAPYEQKKGDPVSSLPRGKIPEGHPLREVDEAILRDRELIRAADKLRLERRRSEPRRRV